MSVKSDSVDVNFKYIKEAIVEFSTSEEKKYIICKEK